MAISSVPRASRTAGALKEASVSSWSSGTKNNPGLTISYLNLFISWIPGAMESLRGTNGEPASVRTQAAGDALHAV